MGKAIIIFDYAISIIFLICFAIMFYLSIKKCFWAEGQSKVKLFFLSLFTSPYLAFTEATVAVVVIGSFFPSIRDDIVTEEIMKGWKYFVYASSCALGFTLLSLFYAWLIGKILKLQNMPAMIFLYMMFDTVAVLINRTTGEGELLNVPYMREIVDILGIMLLFLSVWLFYKWDVLELAKLSKINVKVDWKIFIIPPVIFSLFYSIFVAIFMEKDRIKDDLLMISIYLFSSIIVFLFIWAFHVIIKNIGATNEALTAKDEVKILSVEVMEALAHTIDAKDEYTRGHSVRVAKYSRMIAEKMGLSPEDCENVYYMGLLHDIGKIGVPNEIINSKSKLTDEEYSVIKTHPGIGYAILAEIKSRPDLSIGARWHHERYDGRGYPDGKKGTDIPIFARIIAVADSYDAMTSNRSYREYMSQEMVRSELENNMGTQFDAEVAKCMIEIMDEDEKYELHE